MARADPYADIDFDDVTEATGLAIDEIKCLKVWCSSGGCINPIPFPSWIFRHIAKIYIDPEQFQCLLPHFSSSGSS